MIFIENGANADMNALVENENYNGNAIANEGDENKFSNGGTIASANMNASVEDEIGSGNAIKQMQARSSNMVIPLEMRATTHRVIL